MEAKEMFEKMGLQELKISPIEVMYGDEENEKLRTYASFNRTLFYGDSEPKFRNKIEMFFYPGEGIDFDEFIAAVKKKKEEKGM